jgi:DNA-binding IclR family transcriptional regulator
LRKSGTKKGSGSATRRVVVVRSLARGLSILEAFAGNKPILTNQEIARHTRLPKPTVTRLTQTLTALGYMELAPDSEGFYLAPRLSAIGAAVMNGSGIARVCQPLMQQAADELGAEIGLASRDGTNIVYLENCKTTKEIQHHIVQGTRLPIEIIAIGHAYVAGMSDPDRDTLLDTIKLRHGRSWHQIYSNVQASLKQIERQGFCVADGWAVNLRSAAVTLTLPNAHMPYALDCSGPSSEFPVRKMNATVGPRLLRLAQDIVRLYSTR